VSLLPLGGGVRPSSDATVVSRWLSADSESDDEESPDPELEDSADVSGVGALTGLRVSTFFSFFVAAIAWGVCIWSLGGCTNFFLLLSTAGFGSAVFLVSMLGVPPFVSCERT
jgi:hypothetical protein